MASLSINHDTCDPELFTELERRLAEAGLGKDDVCIVGSTCLSIRGLRDHGDIDIATHPENAHNTPGENRYEVLGIEDRELFTNDHFTDRVDGWRIVRPEIEYCYKKQRRRPKDKEDTEILEAYRQRSDEWNQDLVEKFSLPLWVVLWKNFWRSLRNDGIKTTIRRILNMIDRRRK